MTDMIPWVKFRAELRGIKPSLANKLKDLLVKYPDIDVTAMGFPKNWKNDPFWI